MIREPDTIPLVPPDRRDRNVREGLGAAAWGVAFVMATIVALATLLHPGVWVWLLDADPTIPLLLVMLGVISVWWPR